MKSTIATILIATLAATTALNAQVVPNTLSYQGHVAVSGSAFNNAGDFKFALVSGDGATTYWSNDGTLNGEPASVVTLDVDQGYYSVLLGDPNLGNMLPIPPSVFANPDVHLRIWFNDGQHGSQQLAPDQAISSVGYAMMAEQVASGAVSGEQIVDGSIGASELAPDSVGSSHIINGAVSTFDLANNAVTSAKIADNSVTASDISDVMQFRELDIENSSGLDRIELSGTGESGILRMNHGSIGRFMELQGTTEGGQLKLYDKLGGIGTGQTTVELGSAPTGGFAHWYQDTGDIGVSIYGQNGALTGGRIMVANEAGDTTFVVAGGRGAVTGSEVYLYNHAGTKTIELDGQWDPQRGGTISLFKADGTQSIKLQADYNGSGRIIADVLQLNGADLSETFDINTPGAAPEPGTVVCIDPNEPGKLIASSTAYDHTVAGVISGAGGVRPGLLMGQQGTLATGEHPVALTGRVYCNVDATTAPIRPGDLITTSDLPGHGMKAIDPAQARGAIIGKAMTGLTSGRGQVLVLISLQ